MSDVKPKGRQLTMLDLVQSVMFMGAGAIILMVWYQIDTLPHSGWLMIAGFGLMMFGMLSYIIKYFKQPLVGDVV